jgi:hypothetical protein
LYCHTLFLAALLYSPTHEKGCLFIDKGVPSEP